MADTYLVFLEKSQEAVRRLIDAASENKGKKEVLECRNKLSKILDDFANREIRKQENRRIK